MGFHHEGVGNRVAVEDTTGFFQDFVVTEVTGHLHPVFGIEIGRASCR
jgi:hypothetical protein